jgi:hypothetical protein
VTCTVTKSEGSASYNRLKNNETAKTYTELLQGAATPTLWTAIPFNSELVILGPASNLKPHHRIEQGAEHDGPNTNEGGLQGGHQGVVTDTAKAGKNYLALPLLRGA